MSRHISDAARPARSDFLLCHLGCCPYSWWMLVVLFYLFHLVEMELLSCKIESPPITVQWLRGTKTVMQGEGRACVTHPPWMTVLHCPGSPPPECLEPETPKQPYQLSSPNLWVISLIYHLCPLYLELGSLLTAQFLPPLNFWVSILPIHSFIYSLTYLTHIYGVSLMSQSLFFTLRQLQWTKQTGSVLSVMFTA